MNESEKYIKAASELEGKIIELIRKDYPTVYESDTAFIAIELLMHKFTVGRRFS
jgi:hypothetical protein